MSQPEFDGGGIRGGGGRGGGGSTKPVNTANATKESVRFIEGVTVKDIKTGQSFSGTVDLKPTLDRISSGGTYPHRNDGSVFKQQACLACPHNLLDIIRNMFIQLQIYQGQVLKELLLDKMVKLIIQMIIIRRS
nr:hypothetical protein [Yersinia intermedia]